MHFYQLMPNIPLVQAADSSAMGTLPARAHQYCDGVTTASRQGWYVFPPVSFDLLWTGSEVVYRIGDEPDWSVLERFYLSDAVSAFVETAPEGCQDNYPSFLDVFPEGNIVQIWTGYALRTPPGICYQVRGPINLPMSGSFQYYEAIIDGSWYVAPLITNIKILRQDVPIHFPMHKPLMQVVPLPTAVMSREGIEHNTIELPRCDDQFWIDWKSTYDDRNSGERGSYARKQRHISRNYKPISAD